MPTAESRWRAFSDALLRAIYPTKCALCGQLEDASPCETCEAEMVPNAPMLFPERTGPLAFRATIYPYEGRAGQAVRRLKFARSTSLADFMARRVASVAEELDLDTFTAVPVPIHWSRRSSRGFNQSEMLCERLPLVQAGLLKRNRATRPQVGLNREQRLRNLAGAFTAAPEARGQHILLVDDVLTSGQTARECARTLLEAGAVEVGVLAFCGDTTWAD